MDESSYTSSPNHFLLSTYKENSHINLPETKLNENTNRMLFYKCCLCQKIIDDVMITCSTCVNTGQFCSSKHDTCSNKRREIFLNMLNKNDYEEFQQSSSDESNHFQCSDRMFLLKKFNTEKKLLQSEYQTKIKSSIEIRRMSEEIRIRKNRLNLIKSSIKKLKEQNEEEKKIHIISQQRINEYRLRIKITGKKLIDIKLILQSKNNEVKNYIDLRDKQDAKLQVLRLQRIKELYKYLFPIERILAIEESLATRIRALLSAQQSTDDETNIDPVENDEIVMDEGERYHIANAWLPNNGDYQIDNLVVAVNNQRNLTDPDSPQLSSSQESYEILSALSYACQLTNIVALYLHINLPFRLHQLEFNTDHLTTDCLRADIAKLNANINSLCFSQGISIDFTDVTYTLGNLWQLLTLQQYLSRPKAVNYSPKYIDMIEEEVNEISRAYVTDYWFDDDEEKDVSDLLNSDEWEAILEDDIIPDDSSVHEHTNSSSGQQEQHLSTMSTSIDYFSGLYNSFVRNFKS